MNLTPNSFSDGGELNQLSSLEARIKTWSALTEQKQVVFDWGALSTAPQNAQASHQDQDCEWQRLQLMLPVLPDLSALSIDTFRPEIMQKILAFGSAQQSWIWNDVSGQLDDSTRELLQANPEMSYILCHNLVPNRETTPFHLDYTVKGDDFFYHFLSWFSEKIETFQRWGLNNPLYLDPCFGFSKNYRQNWELIDRFEEFASTFCDFPLVIGISRKSFLRERLLIDQPEYQKLERADLNSKLDRYQEKWLAWFDQIITQPLFYRLHQPPSSGLVL
jgi:dihydropteroate synthase